MNTEQILKVLKNKRDCIKNNHDYCYEDCDESCPYYVSETEEIEVLDFLINAYLMEGKSYISAPCYPEINLDLMVIGDMIQIDEGDTD